VVESEQLVLAVLVHPKYLEEFDLIRMLMHKILVAGVSVTSFVD